MKMNKALQKRFLKTTVFSLALFLSTGSVYAMPVSPSNTAGAIMNHNLQYMMLQQSSPWTFRPANDNDLVHPYNRYWIYQDEDLNFEDAAATQGMLKDANGQTYITGPSFLKDLKKNK